MTTEFDLAPTQGVSAQPVFGSTSEIEEFWRDLHSKVKDDLDRWEQARLQSDEQSSRFHVR